MITEKNNNNNNKSMFLYTALIFFVALILIIISFFGQTNLESKQPAAVKETIENTEEMGEGITQKASILSRENVELINENKELSDEIKKNEEYISSLSLENEILKNNISNYELLLNIYQNLNDNNIEKADELIASIKYDTLTDEQKIIYDNFKNILDKEN